MGNSVNRVLRSVGLMVFAGLFAGLAQAADYIVMASTTSTEQSGLFSLLLPAFTEHSGIEVRVVAQGTGQALATARRGDADLLFVHNRSAEQEFVRQGYGLERHDVMYNDFVIVGPATDPAKIAGGHDVLDALGRIRAAAASFLSRGDKSGTHAAERRFWQAANIDPLATGKGGWYRETGSGMGPTLNIAASSDAYTLTDRGTWLNFRNRRQLKVLVEGDSRLFNQYGIIIVNPARHPHVRMAAARVFEQWILSESGQNAIASYRIDGQQLFFPNAQVGAPGKAQ